MPELLVIMVVALIVLGPKRLPEVARTLGRGLAEFRKATSGITDELRNASTMLEQEIRQAEREGKGKPAAAKAPPAGPAPVAAGPDSGTQTAGVADQTEPPKST